MTQYGGSARPEGNLALKVIRGTGTPESLVRPTHRGELTMREIARYGLPQRDQAREVREWKTRNLPNLWRGFRRVAAARRLGIPHFYGQLWLRKYHGSGQVVDLGLVSMRLVTTAGVGYIVDAFQNSVELELMNFHGIGETNTAEAVGDTALAAEITTEYNPDNTRATGSQGENGANVYQTVGTNTVDAAVGAVEHGILSQAATGGGVLLDRTVFTIVNLASSDALESTYELTVTAGG